MSVVAAAADTPTAAHAQTISPKATRDGTNVTITYAWRLSDVDAEWITTQDNAVIKDEHYSTTGSDGGNTTITIPETQVPGRSHFLIRVKECSFGSSACTARTDYEVYIDVNHPVPGAAPTPAPSGTATTTPQPTPTVTVTAPAPAPIVRVKTQAHPPVATRFKSCADVHRYYSGGIAKSGTVEDKRGKRHTRTLSGVVAYSATAYRANKRLDADRDGIACEKR